MADYGNYSAARNLVTSPRVGIESAQSGHRRLAIEWGPLAGLDTHLACFNHNGAEEARQRLESYNALELFKHVSDSAMGRWVNDPLGMFTLRTHRLGYGHRGSARTACREAIADGTACEAYCRA